MLNLTLAQVFGANATQDATTLTIQKADLLGLTAAADNRGEQLLVGMLLQLHQHFEGVLTDQEGNSIIDQRAITVNFDNRVLYEKLDLWFWKRQFIKRQERNYLLDTFILSAFTPPTEPQPLDPDLL